jgi:NRAMP (natural resistance-associated macrophage protein)-like metal ion transporter
VLNSNTNYSVSSSCPTFSPVASNLSRASLGLSRAKTLRKIVVNIFQTWLRWPLYTLSELAIISTDLAEIIGGAIALNLLFNLHIVAGVVITALDIFLILLFYRPNGTVRGIRWSELGVSLLVLGVLICFAIQLSKTPDLEGREII